MKRSKLYFLRCKGEKVIIGEGEDQVHIEVTRLTPDKVTLTMDAPVSLPIDRFERRLTPGDTDQ